MYITMNGVFCQLDGNIYFHQKYSNYEVIPSTSVLLNEAKELRPTVSSTNLVRMRVMRSSEVCFIDFCNEAILLELTFQVVI